MVRKARWTLWLVALTTLVTAACPPAPAPCQDSTEPTGTFIPDPVLEAIVRERTHTRYGALGPTDLESVFVIEASRFFASQRPCIYSVEGLQYAVNLTKLDLRWNAISNISPLSSLTKLTTLSLAYNNISDVAPLAPLGSLVELDLARNQISDITPLLSLPNLRTLYLTGNRLELSEGSQAMQVITELKARGVAVGY